MSPPTKNTHSVHKMPMECFEGLIKEKYTSSALLEFRLHPTASIRTRQRVWHLDSEGQNFQKNFCCVCVCVYAYMHVSVCACMCVWKWFALDVHYKHLRTNLSLTTCTFCIVTRWHCHVNIARCRGVCTGCLLSLSVYSAMFSLAGGYTELSGSYQRSSPRWTEESGSGTGALLAR